MLTIHKDKDAENRKEVGKPKDNTYQRKPLANLTNKNSNMLTTLPSENIRELKCALADALRENEKLHSICKGLAAENKELKLVRSELRIVSMLYESARSELEDAENKQEKAIN